MSSNLALTPQDSDSGKSLLWTFFSPIVGLKTSLVTCPTLDGSSPARPTIDNGEMSNAPLYSALSLTQRGMLLTSMSVVHYRVFYLDGAIESKCAFRADDPYTGRAVASRITPPHTVDLIKRFLCKQEGIPYSDKTSLFVSLTCESELDDKDRLQVLSGGGPGWSADDPMAIVIKDPLCSSSHLMGNTEAVTGAPMSSNGTCPVSNRDDNSIDCE
jgi:hypothetical protein